MRELFDFLKHKKNLVGLLILVVLISGLLGGISLIRQQQIIKSRAAEDLAYCTCTAGRYDDDNGGTCPFPYKGAACRPASAPADFTHCICAAGEFNDYGGSCPAKGTACNPPSQPGGTNATPSVYQTPGGSTGQICVPGSYDRHCTGKCGGCAANAGEMEVKQCKADGTGYGSSFGECSTVCAGACSANPSSVPAGGVSRGTKDCKATFAPSELGINDPRVCDRLHQYTSNNCGRRCDTSNDCPQNTDQPNYVNPATSNWCYEFKDNDNDPNNNNRCLQLRYKGTGTEPSCVSGETGVGACSGNACVDCILKNRTDILPYYGKNGWDTSCGNQAKITENWCGIDPTSCRSVKSTQCTQECGAGGPGVPGGKYTVSGKVFQADGVTPAAGVKVEVWNDLATPASSSNTTNANGEFTVSDFIDNGKAYAVRIPKTQSSTMTITKISTLNNTSSRNFAGQFAGKNTPLGNESYEFQLTTDTVCATACNFKIEATTIGTIGGKVVNAAGAGVKDVKVWISDELGSVSHAGGKYKSVITDATGQFSGQVTIGSPGYWVRIPDQATLGEDGANNIAIFTAKQATKAPFANTSSQSYETQAFNNISHGCWNDCDFTVTQVPLFPTRVRVAGSEPKLLLAGVYEHEFSGQYTPSNPLIVDWTLDDLPIALHVGNGSTRPPQRVYIQFGFGTGSNFQWDTTNTYQSEAVTYTPTPSPSPSPISSPSPSPSSSPSTRRMPGDADDNKCVNTDDYTIWKQEVRGGRSTKCANWTTENPPIVDTEDYGIWYRAWKVLSNRENCITPPAGRCLDQR